MGSAPASSRSTTPFALREVATGKLHPLGDSFVIGRATGNLVLSNDGKASGRHCTLSVANGRVFVQDLNSSNGTFINGGRVSPGQPQMIAVNSVLQVGNTSFRIESAPVGAATPRPVPGPAPVFQPARAAESERPDVAYALIALNIAVFGFLVAFRGVDFTDATPSSLIANGGNIWDVTSQKQWWRLASAMFMHGGIAHLFSNMLGLYFAGKILTDVIGNFRLGIVYLGAGLLGGVASLAFNPLNVVSVGASGAIFGCFGGILLLQILKRSNFKDLGPFGFLSTIQFIGTNLGIDKAGIDVAAHAGGLIAGFLLTLLLVADESDENDARPWLVLAGAIVTVAGLCLFLQKKLPPARPIPTAAEAPATAARPAATESEAMLGIDEALRVYSEVNKEMGRLLKEFKAGKITREHLNSSLTDLRKVPVAALQDIEKVDARTPKEKQLKEIQGRLFNITDDVLRLMAESNDTNDHANALKIDVLALQQNELIIAYQKALTGEIVELPQLVLMRGKSEPPPPQPREAAPRPEAPTTAEHITPSYVDPANVCRSSFNRYARVSSSLLSRCRQANPYSARAIDIYSSIYKAGMGSGLIDALFRIQNQSQLDCATQIARRFSGRMTAPYLTKTCL